MQVGAEVGALGTAATMATEAPQTVAQQIDYLFAQQLLHAMTRSAHLDEASGETAGYLGMLEGHLAKELAEQGSLGVGAALASEVDS